MGNPTSKAVNNVTLIRQSAENYNHLDSHNFRINNLIEKIDCIIADRFFPGFDSVMNKLPQACREYGYKGKIVLASNSVIEGEVPVGFDEAASKDRVRELLISI